MEWQGQQGPRWIRSPKTAVRLPYFHSHCEWKRLAGHAFPSLISSPVVGEDEGGGLDALGEGVRVAIFGIARRMSDQT
jgi:hypothetical protein